ncbi:hypothetical protein NDU88_000918 [Pleurodeles waltl]|uniref:Uncharacterized protein n=1 Tax=Pleurodeles waltl TaxID=8319 RepID=A0AAV7LBM1_PLEWA|nr:hypothetical protein NDU88_000918 [Pleurodeles waltl]
MVTWERHQTLWARTSWTHKEKRQRIIRRRSCRRHRRRRRRRRRRTPRKERRRRPRRRSFAPLKQLRRPARQFLFEAESLPAANPAKSGSEGDQIIQRPPKLQKENKIPDN